MYIKAVAHGLQLLLHARGETHSSSTQTHMASWSTARRFLFSDNIIAIGRALMMLLLLRQVTLR